MMTTTPDEHAYAAGPPCKVEYIHEGAHVCDVPYCELTQDQHPDDE